MMISTLCEKKYGWLTCNISIKDLIVNLPGPLHSATQPAQFVKFPTNVYSNKVTQFGA